MRILWLTMQALPVITKSIDPEAKIPPTGGWMEGISRKIIEQNSEDFAYCFPSDSVTSGSVNGFKWYSIKKIRDFSNYTTSDLEELKFVIDDFEPDIIHLFGTEHTHQTQLVFMVRELGYIDRLVIWIQGLVSVYAKHYNAGLPEVLMIKRTMKEVFKRNNLNDMKSNMAKRGEEEIECLKIAKHVFVRTDWDEAACKAINPKLSIHWCNETLRSSFYEPPYWNLEKIRKHSIFVSQSNYPIKGLHKLLEAMPIIANEFPDVKIYTTGVDYLHYSKTIDKLRLSTYQKEIIRLIRKNHLEENIVFMGILAEQKMKEAYLQAHVFVSASSIENSPNSLGEAMLLGVPSVVSDVGGVKNMMTHGEEGLIYPFDEPYVLAEYVCRIFRDDNLAVRFSEHAQMHSSDTHSPEKNYVQLLKEYTSIVK